MGRPVKSEGDPTKKQPVGVSLTRAERQKLKALGGSAWISAMLTAFPENLQPVPPGTFLVPHGGILVPPRRGSKLSVISK